MTLLSANARRHIRTVILAPLWYFFLDRVPRMFFPLLQKRIPNSVQASGFFRPAKPWKYPVHDGQKAIEEHFFDFWNRVDVAERECLRWKYLPIFWTNYYNTYTAMRPCPKIQRLLDQEIEEDVVYFAVVQADNGILEKLPKNVLVFGAGGVGNIPIPLASSTVVPGRAHRDIFASFVGVIDNHANNRTGIRSLMRDRLQNEKDFFIREAKTDVNLFHDTMTRSVFALCPRGFGKTSFRLYEAMAMGAIPVYIYDDPWLPYTEFLDWESFSVLVPLESIGDIPAILRSHTAEDIRKKQQRICELQSEGHFSFEGICRYIFNTLAERSPGPLLTRN